MQESAEQVSDHSSASADPLPGGGRLRRIGRSKIALWKRHRRSGAWLAVRFEVETSLVEGEEEQIRERPLEHRRKGITALTLNVVKSASFCLFVLVVLVVVDIGKDGKTER